MVSFSPAAKSPPRFKLAEPLAKPSHTKGVDFTANFCLPFYNNSFWPLWTSIPVPWRYIRILEVDLKLDKEFMRCMSHPGQGLMFLPLFALLNQFIYHGPSFFRSYNGVACLPPSGLRLERLQINLLTHSYLEIQDYGHTRLPSTVPSTIDFMLIFNTLTKFLNHACMSGYLHPTAERLKVVCGQQSYEYLVFPMGTWSAWVFEGYEWGPTPYFTASQWSREANYRSTVNSMRYAVGRTVGRENAATMWAKGWKMVRENVETFLRRTKG